MYFNKVVLLFLLRRSSIEAKGCKKQDFDQIIAQSVDSWQHYDAGGMQILSVTGGSNQSKYNKTVVMLHGGGGAGYDWVCQYRDGWFGDLNGLKYVFPTSPLEGSVWFYTYKNGCGLGDDCAYDIPSIEQAATNVADLLDEEAALLDGDRSKLYLGGFSEGAQLAGYMQIAKIDYALGGTIIMDGYPIPPLCDMPGKDPSAAKQNASYTGDDMAWMIWHGEADKIFPVDETMTAWNGIFDTLSIQATLKIEHIEPLQGHTLIEPEFEALTAFVRG